MFKCRHAIVLACLAALVVTGGGCSSDDPAAEPATLDTEERAALERSNRRQLSVQKLGTLADGLFDFDPTIDPSQSAEANAQAIAARATTELSGCGTVSLQGTTVTIAFGGPPGCTINGLVVSGAVSASVSKVAPSITVALSLTQVVVDGRDLAGAVTFVTSTGFDFRVDGSLTSDGETLTMTALQVAGSAGAFTTNGAVEAVEANGARTGLVLTAVRYVEGDCYPSAGTMDVSKGHVKMRVAFTSATADSGQVTVTSGRKSETATLPAYGDCPGGAGTHTGRDAGVRLDGGRTGGPRASAEP